ncbi:MAG TPA: outer membrane lipoprotein carrier protein LolA [Gemmatimonadaceae bacterium]|nr:outer membrane lipoprotein carrier protein LolA [Gemmatimonadaceae bacterium]
MRIWFVAAAVCAAPLAAAHAQTPEAVVKRAVAAYRAVHTVKASFTQTLTNPLLGSKVVSHGELVQRMPGRLSVRFTDPDGDRIVADGQWVWIYMPSSNPGQVLRMRAGSGVAGSADVTAQFLESPTTRYRLSDGGADTVHGRPAHVVVLVPRDSSIPFTRARIWVDDKDALVRQFETEDTNGVVRFVTIDDVRTNVPVSASAFRFTPPPGVKVYDRGSGGQ